MGNTGRKAVFLDRDGTINHDGGYTFKVEEFVMLPGVPEALVILQELGYALIVTTNQSGIARGYYGVEDLDLFHEYLQGQLAGHGVAIDHFYFSPYHPKGSVEQWRVDSDCRKPRPGMILRAVAEHGIDLAQSVTIGDRISDVEAGRGANCRAILLDGALASPQLRPLDGPHSPVDEAPVNSLWDASSHYVVCRDLLQAAKLLQGLGATATVGGR